MENSKICLLNETFFEKYPSSKYPEIEFKENRPFLVLLIELDNNIFAIPFRTNVKHKYAYKFKKSNKLPKNKPALDFHKSVIITDDMVGKLATIDEKEYLELKEKESEIIESFKKFLNHYKEVIKNPKENTYDYNNFKKYSSLQYFHKELNL